MHEVYIDGVRYVPEQAEQPGPIPEFAIAPAGFTYSDRWFSVAFDPDNIPVQLALSDDDIQLEAERLGVHPAHIDAVRQVEAGDSGFLLREPPPARPKILFEGHWFYRLTPKPVSKTRPDLSHPTWTKEHYKGGSAEWERLRDACGFDFHNALKSASWGMGQVMGFNYELAGAASVEDFVEQVFSGEAAQFSHMLNYVVNTDLLGALRDGRWTEFARGYNGPGYAENQYHVRLAAAVAASKLLNK